MQKRDKVRRHAHSLPSVRVLREPPADVAAITRVLATIRLLPVLHPYPARPVHAVTMLRHNGGRLGDLVRPARVVVAVAASVPGGGAGDTPVYVPAFDLVAFVAPFGEEVVGGCEIFHVHDPADAAFFGDGNSAPGDGIGVSVGVHGGQGAGDKGGNFGGIVSVD